jgi:NAD(P)-dependent dehydrogenase (short-subunit alcohol dehydrogenase family)
MRIEGSSALIVGGASGLGEATARHLAASGATVTICDLNAGTGTALAGELGGEFVLTDVRDEAQMQAAVDAAAARDGGLRVCVVCAGTAIGQKTAGTQGPHSLADFERVVGVNLVGTFNAWRLAAAAMIDNEPDEQGERGVLIGTASIAAFDGQIGQVAYSASKGGVVGMTLPVARDLARYGIRVNTIAPGLFDTPMVAGLPQDTRDSLGRSVPFPPRLGEPAEYAQLAEQLIVNQMLNAAVIRLDGAIRMAPR